MDPHTTAEVALNGGLKIQAAIEKTTDSSLEQIENNPDNNQSWLDIESLELPLMIRAREKGERFTPLGMDGKSIKIADYMINKKIPRLARSNFPLIISGQKIVWLPGYQIGHKFRVQSNTENILHLHLIQEDK